MLVYLISVIIWRFWGQKVVFNKARLLLNQLFCATFERLISLEILLGLLRNLQSMTVVIVCLILRLLYGFIRLLLAHFFVISPLRACEELAGEVTNLIELIHRVLRLWLLSQRLLDYALLL